MVAGVYTCHVLHHVAPQSCLSKPLWDVHFWDIDQRGSAARSCGFFRCDARLGIFGVDVHGGGCRAGETGMDSFSLLHTLCHNARLAPRLWDFSAGYLLKMKPQHGWLEAKNSSQICDSKLTCCLIWHTLWLTNIAMEHLHTSEDLGNTSSNGPFSIAMLAYRRVCHNSSCIFWYTLERFLQHRCSGQFFCAGSVSPQGNRHDWLENPPWMKMYFL